MVAQLTEFTRRGVTCWEPSQKWALLVLTGPCFYSAVSKISIIICDVCDILNVNKYIIWALSEKQRRTVWCSLC